MPGVGESIVILCILAPFVIALIAIRWHRKKRGGP